MRDEARRTCDLTSPNLTTLVRQTVCSLAQCQTAYKRQVLCCANTTAILSRERGSSGSESVTWVRAGSDIELEAIPAAHSPVESGTPFSADAVRPGYAIQDIELLERLVVLESGCQRHGPSIFHPIAGERQGS